MAAQAGALKSRGGMSVAVLGVNPNSRPTTRLAKSSLRRFSALCSFSLQTKKARLRSVLHPSEADSPLITPCAESATANRANMNALHSPARRSGRQAKSLAKGLANFPISRRNCSTSNELRSKLFFSKITLIAQSRHLARELVTGACKRLHPQVVEEMPRPTFFATASLYPPPKKKRRLSPARTPFPADHVPATRAEKSQLETAFFAVRLARPEGQGAPAPIV